MKQTDISLALSFIFFFVGIAVAAIWGDYAKAAYWMASAAYWRIAYWQDVKEPES